MEVEDSGRWVSEGEKDRKVGKACLQQFSSSDKM